MLEAPDDLPISSVLDIRAGRLRSVRIDRDLDDPAASERFVATPFAKASLRRLARGLLPRSSERAWRLTGDYGSGKSSVALALCRMAADAGVPVDRDEASERIRLLPIVAAGQREPIGRSLLRGLRESASRFGFALDRRTKALLRDADAPETERVLRAIEEIAGLCRASGTGDGVLIVLDELGKNLEHAAWAGGGLDDVFLLQLLAEAAVRSGTAPIMVVAILHQSVAGYAAGLPSMARREWEKVAGRFEEIVYSPPLDEIAVLVSAALGVRVDGLPDRLVDEAEGTMRAAVDAGWFGAGASRRELVALSARLFPLDPTTLPLLSRVFRRFGQNERSLFGFLASSEPGGLAEYVRRPLGGATPYRIADLYDYVNANLAGVLSLGPTNSRWAIVSAVVGSSAVSSPIELAVLKTVALLNVLDDPALPSNLEAVVLAVAGSDARRAEEAREAVARFMAANRVLHRRGSSGTLSLWPNTSVDLEASFELGLRAVSTDDSVRSLLPSLPRDPLVARRHYVETGALRHFERVYVGTERLAEALASPIPDGAAAADGRVLVVLTRDRTERDVAIDLIEGASEVLDPRFIIAVPLPIGGIDPMLRDVQAWRWVRDNAEGLAGDRFARAEASRQLALSEDRLGRAIAGLVEGGSGATEWFGGGRRLGLSTERELITHLSDVCDNAFDESPIIRNELINRRVLSSAAARARSLVIEALATRSHVPDLGIPSTGTPPERAIYLSVLRRGGVHVERDGGWAVVVPEADDDPLRLRPALDAIHDLLLAVPDARVPYEDVVARLRGGRLGIREGLVPLVVAIYLAAHWHHTAVYEDGTYLDQVGGPEFVRMVKESEHFTLQHCSIVGVRAGVFGRLAEAIGVERDGADLELLDVVRPLSRFVATIPDYARRTRRLSAATVALRDALTAARDPAALLFSEMPRACGLDPVGVVDAMPDRDAEVFVATVRTAVRELRDAYPDLLRRLFEGLASALEVGETKPAGIRAVAGDRARRLVENVTEPELKTFLLRLSDTVLDDRAWLESLASTVARKPPERWGDGDEVEFLHRVPQLSRRFRRVEAAAFDGRSDEGAGSDAYRLVVTSSNGRELEEVLRPVGLEGEELAALEGEIAAFLERNGRAGAFAATRMLMASLENRID
ncbi:ATP-binding protein [Sphingomonas panni]|uniref:ATP-binding protein n=1 Tax=Sphingomonas panni TaxID=237612 RepID=UPI001F5B5533|nr:ATP-binding protein [Sphingomonas panni]